MPSVNRPTKRNTEFPNAHDTQNCTDSNSLGGTNLPGKKFLFASLMSIYFNRTLPFLLHRCRSKMQSAAVTYAIILGDYFMPLRRRISFIISIA